MKSLLTAPRRSLAAGVAGVLVAGAAAVVAAAPAQAAPTSAQLTWNVSQQFINSLSTRTLSGGASFDEAAKTFTFPQTSTTTDAAGTRTSSFAGTVRGAFVNGGAEFYSVTLSNPQVVVEADGDGRISATVSSKGSNADANVEFGGGTVTVAEFSGATSTTEGVTTATPFWENVLMPGSPEAIALELSAGRPVDGKSFHRDFLAEIHKDIRAHFHFTSGSDAKRPGVVTIAPTKPQVTAAVTAASLAAGVSIKVDGKGFSSAVNDGDKGVYVALAPADTVINYADRSSLASMPAVDYVTPQRFTADSFTSVLNATTDKLKVGTQYAVFTWQAHTHSNSTQDTKTPVTIDWTAFATPAPAKVDATTTLKLSKKPTLKKAGKALVIVQGGTTLGSGKVVVTIKRAGVKKAAKATVTLDSKGRATVKLPKAKKKGAYKIVVTYAGDDRLNAAKKLVKKFKVKK